MKILSQLAQKINFLIVLFGVAGSLYFSEVMGFPPCVLCWYQRILLYPLLMIYAVSLWTNDGKYQKYVLPFIALGILVAGYHNLLYYGILSESIAPCVAGVSCTTIQLELLGFITIPLMSLLCFLTIGFLEFAAFGLHKKEVSREE